MGMQVVTLLKEGAHFENLGNLHFAKKSACFFLNICIKPIRIRLKCEVMSWFVRSKTMYLLLNRNAFYQAMAHLHIKYNTEI